MARKPDTIGYKEFNKMVVDENQMPKKKSSRRSVIR